MLDVDSLGQEKEYLVNTLEEENHGLEEEIHALKEGQYVLEF